MIADGNETRFRQAHTREIVLAMALISLVVWAFARRPVAIA
jgi:hypothetical protein